MPARKRAPQVHLYHATAPTCWWSWGYEAVLNRIPLVYGDGVQIHLLLGCVYEDLDEWMKAYEMTPKGQAAWARESIGIMGVPIRTNYDRDEPRNVMPATLAVLAARRQGDAKGERFMRAVLRRFTVEGQDVSRDEVLRDAAAEALLNVKAFVRDCREADARRAELEHQGHDFPHVPLGFYSLALTDGRDRTVLLDYAFDPAVVEEAIDYLAQGRLKKRAPRDALVYLKRHGPASLPEIARVLGVREADARTQLQRLAKANRTEKVSLGGQAHWKAAERP